MLFKHNLHKYVRFVIFTGICWRGMGGKCGGKWVGNAWEFNCNALIQPIVPRPGNEQFHNGVEG